MKSASFKKKIPTDYLFTNPTHAHIYIYIYIYIYYRFYISNDIEVCVRP